ncbi:MAG: SGNH/GDSL hydrolase family protein, partial [Victivallaceae bacterium]
MEFLNLGICGATTEQIFTGEIESLQEFSPTLTIMMGGTNDTCNPDSLRELEDIKIGVVNNWLGDEPLAGGHGRALKKWQREPQNLLIFKDHSSMLKSIAESTAIRSNGHAWCTADNDG